MDVDKSPQVDDPCISYVFNWLSYVLSSSSVFCDSLIAGKSQGSMVTAHTGRDRQSATMLSSPLM